MLRPHGKQLLQFLAFTDSGPYANDIAKACKWAAITCVVVTVPVLGKVTQVGAERTLGTIIGACGMTAHMALG